MHYWTHWVSCGIRIFISKRCFLNLRDILWKWWFLGKTNIANWSWKSLERLTMSSPKTLHFSISFSTEDETEIICPWGLCIEKESLSYKLDRLWNLKLMDFSVLDFLVLKTDWKLSWADKSYPRALIVNTIVEAAFLFVAG